MPEGTALQFVMPEKSQSLRKVSRMRIRCRRLDYVVVVTHVVQ